MYLDRGYAFFAPDPGPSHLIQAGLTNDAGNLTEKMYPDLEQQWPRLLYHRHFMLAEFLTNAHQPPGPPPELIQADPDTATSWRNARSRYEHLRLSMTKHLEHAHPGQTAAIRRIEHLIPGVLEFREEPIVLTDKRLYQVLLDNPAALQTNGDPAAANQWRFGRSGPKPRSDCSPAGSGIGQSKNRSTRKGATSGNRTRITAGDNRTAVRVK